MKEMKKLLVSIFLLITSIAYTKDYSLGQWEWDAELGTNGQGVATGYKIYYTSVTCCSSLSGCLFYTNNMVSVPADINHCGLLHCHSANTCCGDFPYVPPSSVTFVVVTAFNAVGESSTEHGNNHNQICP